MYIELAACAAECQNCATTIADTCSCDCQNGFNGPNCAGTVVCCDFVLHCTCIIQHACQGWVIILHSTVHVIHMHVVHGHTFGNRMIRRALSLCIEHRLGLADECFNDDPNGYCGGNPGYPKSWCTDEYPWVIRECQAFCGFCSKFLALSYQNVIA